MVKEAKGFESALKKLEGITQRLENEDVSLEESLALFEEGVKLVKLLQGKLSEAERKVEILVREAEGKFRLEDFNEDD